MVTIIISSVGGNKAGGCRVGGIGGRIDFVRDGGVGGGGGGGDKSLIQFESPLKKSAGIEVSDFLNAGFPPQI